MKKTVNKNNIGKKCQCYMLGEKTKGIITAIEGESIKITFDEPISWGHDVFNYAWFSGTQLKYITINKQCKQ